jgi:AAA domain
LFHAVRKPITWDRVLVEAALLTVQPQPNEAVGVLPVDEARKLSGRDHPGVVVEGGQVEAGAPMRTLSDHIGRVELHENIRQQDAWERAALQLLRNCEARAAYSEYQSYGRIHDADSVAERRVQVIEDHARLEAGVATRSSSPCAVTRWSRSRAGSTRW